MFTRNYLRRNYVIFGSVWTIISIVRDLYVPWGGGLDWETSTNVLTGWVGCTIGFALMGGFRRSTPEAVSSQQDTDRQRNLKKMASIGGGVLMTTAIGLALFMPRGLIWLSLLMWPAIAVVAALFSWWLMWMWKRLDKDRRADSGISLKEDDKAT